MHSQTLNQSTNANDGQEKQKDWPGVNPSSISTEIIVVTDVDDSYETEIIVVTDLCHFGLLMIVGITWLGLFPLTGRKHQVISIDRHLSLNKNLSTGITVTTRKLALFFCPKPPSSESTTQRFLEHRLLGTTSTDVKSAPELDASSRELSTGNCSGNVPLVLSWVVEEHPQLHLQFFTASRWCSLITANLYGVHNWGFDVDYVLLKTTTRENSF